jgi:hypothetical protein
MSGTKTSMIVSSVAFLVIGACGSVAFPAPASHRGHAAQEKAAAPVPSQLKTPVPSAFNAHLPYAWTQKEPTYMAIQSQFYRDGSSEK